ncbi:MAG: alpha/beta hydrolase [Deltaproteobacteria bacterium]|nr:alpha/beta hydrolase [Deltaproteobacteria bacterium]MBW2413481.1 alpha/beta hydrolase [Deltaproteobacteria bacterium]
MSSFPEPRRISIPERSGSLGRTIPAIDLSVHEAGDGPPVVLCHGFPELAYSWRHQVEALADAGFRAIAPDQRGYGASDSPEGVESFDLEHLTSDMAGLLDALGIERAVFAGHDWGGFVAWAMPLAYPDRTAGVIGVNTPYVPFPDTALLRQAFPDDSKLYILWFQEPGVAESVLDRNPRLIFEKMMRGGREPQAESGLTAMTDANPFLRIEGLEDIGAPMLSDEELDYYARGFEKSGFRGGVSWYRNIDRNRTLYPEIGTQRLELPCLMVTAEWDGALRPEMAAGMPALCADLETHMIEKCGHWTQQEKPEELNRLMVDWLGRRFALPR